MALGLKFDLEHFRFEFKAIALYLAGEFGF